MIVNADSTQVYRDLPVLSAAPTPAISPGQSTGSTAFSTAPFPAPRRTGRKLARREIADIHAQGRLPILAGGTGLYLRTLLDGIAPVPEIDPEVRRRSGNRWSRIIARGSRSSIPTPQFT